MKKGSKSKDKEKKELREDLFPFEYIIDFNATQAAIRCGCSPRSARTLGARLFAKDNIKNKIKELQEEQKKKALLTVDELDRRCAALNRPTIKDFYKEDGTPKRIHELTDDQAACVKEVGLLGPGVIAPTKLVDFHQTLRTGMQRLGMLKDIIEHQVESYADRIKRLRAERSKAGNR